MPVARRHPSGSGPHFRRPGDGKIYRGSRKQLRRIKWQQHTPVECWIYLALLLVVLLIVMAWLIKHPPPVHHHGTDVVIGAQLSR
jgi:H+/Cl- antiporter ClcA